MDAAQVVMVTGAASGLGRATALSLAKQGHQVFGTLRRLGPEDSGLGFIPVVMDVTSDESVRQAVASVVAQAGRIDWLVNAAGHALSGAGEEPGGPEGRGRFETGLLGFHLVTRAVLPTMRRQGYGRISNGSSVLGLLPAPFLGLHAASPPAPATTSAAG